MPINETRGIWRGKCVGNGECFGKGEWRDKNGKLIFEGNIIDYENGDGICTYIVAWDKERSRFAVADDWYGETKIISDFEFYSPSECTVIGNIHDNPDLLKGAENS